MKTILAVLTCLGAADVAWAHDTWLIPARFRVDPGGGLTLHLTSAMAFPKPETAVKADRLAEAKLRIAGETSALQGSESAAALVLTARPAKAGVATLWVATRERSLELKPDELAHYLREVGAADTIGRDWEKAGRKPWRETYVKRAKTFVRVGDATDESWGQAVGLDLEIVPQSDPTALAAGDTLGLRLFWRGSPLPGLDVAAVAAAPAKPELAKTDADGRVSFVLSKAGPWLVRATLIRPSEARPGEWDSVFTTLTLDARPR